MYITFVEHDENKDNVLTKPMSSPPKIRPIPIHEGPSHADVVDRKVYERHPDTITLTLNTNFVVGSVVALLVMNVVLIFLVALLLVLHKK